MQWAPQQEQALVKVQKWLDADISPQIFRLFGYAGSGKTTMAIEIAEMVSGSCLFASFTGKAALVMRKKGCHGARTLHSLIYKPRRKDRGDEELDRDIPMWEINPDSELSEADLLIIDECSMVGDDLAKDVVSFNKKILVLGDPMQLPPISGAGYFTEGTEPDVMLTEIHRQALDNPIIRIATDIRTGVGIKIGTHKGATDKQGVWIINRSAVKLSSELGADQILCGKNDSRVTINKRIREQLRAEGKLEKGNHLPVLGDRVICLKNKRDRGLLNGAMWKVTNLRDRAFGAKKKGRGDVSYIDIKSTDEADRMSYASVPHPYWYWSGKTNDLVLPEKMQRSSYDEFDYAYAITCHKSQGSQWDKVLVHDESSVFGRGPDSEDIPARWLYTACTRAAEALIIAM